MKNLRQKTPRPARRSKQLTTLGFFAITVIMVMDIYEFPVFATSGLSLGFFLVVGGLLWFLPAALCSAEMATVEAWRDGGIFAWVEGTLGTRLGFAALFFQWFQITICFVTMLYFIVSVLEAPLQGFAALASLDDNPAIKFVVATVIFWLITVFQLGGTKHTEAIGRVAFIVGVCIPMLVLAGLFIAYLASGSPLQIALTPAALLPDFSHVSTLVVFVAFILAYGGIEASAPYANDLENPKREYPRVILMAVVVAILINTVGGLSIAATVPAEELSLSKGIIQALQLLLAHFNGNLTWLADGIALCIAVGVVGEISGWVTGPVREMHDAAKEGFLPPLFARTNRHDVPVPLVLAQGVVVTVWTGVLTFGGGGANLSFLAAISLTTAVYLLAYLLLFVGYLVLVYKKRRLKRLYEVPGKTLGKTLVAVCGLVLSLCALAISFVPPASIEQLQTGAYEAILAGGFVSVMLAPFILYAVRRKKIKAALTRRADKAPGRRNP
ncbi:MAG: amino acid permease [Coriobacteriales bacterium]|jgi:glutamate:gamma-aminobutyrate antiporter|nr:amino acid permease [Coriobacteriales bacterium]